MRILHIVPTYLPAVRYGGPIFAVHALCAALARRGLDVEVYTTSVDGPGDSPVPIGSAFLMDGVKVWYFRSPWMRRLYYSPGMARALSAHCGTFDLVHLHSVFLWPTWAGARSAAQAGVPYLLSPRGMLVETLIARKSAHLKRAWIRLIERRNLVRAAGIHVTSDAEADDLKHFGFTLPEIYEVPNGVSLDDEGGEKRAMPDEIARVLSGPRPVVLFLGRISWKKGLDRLLRAMRWLPDATLLVVGNDEERYTPQLEALAIAEGVRDRVVFAGPVYGSGKAEIYRRAAVFALPSYSENFGNVVLEAMIEACPVVVTPEVGSAKIVSESRGGLVAGGEPRVFAAAIRQILADRSMGEECGRVGQIYVRSRYSWDAVAAQMERVYREIAVGNAHRGDN